MKTRILPINFTNDLDKLNTQGNGVMHVGIEKMSITYIQPADTYSSTDEDQMLTISTQYCEGVTTNSIEKQEGYYFDISIPEDNHWSVSDGDELKALIDDFRNRLYMKQTNQQDGSENNIQK